MNLVLISTQIFGIIHSVWPPPLCYAPIPLSLGNCAAKISTLLPSAARFRDLLLFGLLLKPFGDHYFALATWQFGLILKMNQKLVQN